MAHTIVYGGTFDPIHHGHLITCQRAWEILRADRVLFVPAGVSPHKTGRAPEAAGAQRLAMVQLAIAGVPYFAVDGRELTRQGPSYTADTMDELQQSGGPDDHWTLLIGADQLGKLHSWHRVKYLLASGQGRGVAILARPVERGGVGVEAGLASICTNLGEEVAERLRRVVLATPLMDISATGIRQRVRQGLPIDYLVPAAVAEYIRKQGLYL